MIPRRIAFAALLSTIAACSSAPDPLPADAGRFNVCEAAAQPIGSRIRVAGEFRGTDYALEPRTITLGSDDLCSNRGAGLVFAEVADASEMAKIANARPRSKRGPETPGTMLTIEGTITKVEEGRFAWLQAALVQ